MITTPTRINPIPKMAGKSNFCPNKNTDTKAVRTSPTPAQMAYAMPSGNSFSERDKKKKHAP